MVTPGAGIPLGRSSVRTGSMGKLYQSGMTSQARGITQRCTKTVQSRLPCDRHLKPAYSRSDLKKMIRSRTEPIIVASVNPMKLTRGTPR